MYVANTEVKEKKRSVENTLLDVLKHAKIHCQAGADGVMIHSKNQDPSEVLSSVRGFRHRDKGIPFVVVFTSHSEQMALLTTNTNTLSLLFLRQSFIFKTVESLSLPGSCERIDCGLFIQMFGTPVSG